MEIPPSALIGVCLFAWTMWAVLFWGSIKIVERHNPFNTFGWALVWSTLQIVMAVLLGGADIFRLVFLAVWIVVLMRLLLNRYELGLLHALVVVIATVVGPYFIDDIFLAFVGESTSLLMIGLYAVPAAVLGVWLWSRFGRRAPADTNLPEARAQRVRKRAPAPAAIAPAPAPVAAEAPPVAAPPVAAPPPITAPAAPAAPRADGEPSVLR
jgi:hypothetical protein